MWYNVQKKKVAKKMDIHKTSEQDKGAKEKELRQRKIKNHKRMGILLLILILLGLFFAIYQYFQHKTYEGYEVLSSNSITDMASVDYENFHGKLLKYSKDGITYLNNDGSSIWAETFSMQSPKLVMSDDFVAVADIKGNAVYLFNTEGKVGNYTMANPICDIELANQGVFAVVLEDDTLNYIRMYDKDGNYLVGTQTSIDTSGYPLDITLSPDGKKLVASYIVIDGVNTKNVIAFYNFGKEGQNANSDRLVGAQNYTDTIFPKVEFVDANTVCAFGDNRAVLFTMKHKPSKKAEITFKTEINSIFSSDQHIGFISRNSSSESKQKYTIDIYSTSGRRVFTKQTSIDYRKVRFYKKDILLIGDYDCTIINMNGTQKFYSSFPKGITNMIPDGKWNHYIVVSPNETQVIRLK